MKRKFSLLLLLSSLLFILYSAKPPDDAFNCYVENGWGQCCVYNSCDPMWGYCPCDHCNPSISNRNCNGNVWGPM